MKLTEKQLFNWLSNRRSDYKKGLLSETQIKSLEAIPCWSWDSYTEKWENGYLHLKENINPSKDYVAKDGFRLGDWAARQRRDYQLGKLSQERIQRLESLPNWEWTPDDARWKEKWKLSLESGMVFGSHVTKSGIKLGVWQAKQRLLYKRGDLPKDKIKLMRQVPNWKWSFTKKERVHRAVIMIKAKAKARKAKKRA